MKPRVKGGARARKVVLRRRHALYRGSGDREGCVAANECHKNKEHEQDGPSLEHFTARSRDQKRALRWSAGSSSGGRESALVESRWMSWQGRGRADREAGGGRAGGRARNELPHLMAVVLVKDKRGKRLPRLAANTRGALRRC